MTPFKLVPEQQRVRLVHTSLQSSASLFGSSVLSTFSVWCCTDKEELDEKADALNRGLNPFSDFGDVGGRGTSNLPQATSGTSRPQSPHFARMVNLRLPKNLDGEPGGFGHMSGAMGVCSAFGLHRDVLLLIAVAPWGKDPWAPS